MILPIDLREARLIARRQTAMLPERRHINALWAAMQGRICSVCGVESEADTGQPVVCLPCEREKGGEG